MPQTGGKCFTDIFPPRTICPGRLKRFRKTNFLQRRRERYTIIHTRKILQNKAPNSTGLEFYNNDRLGVRIKILPFNNKAQRSVSTAYDNSFGVKSVRLWRNLLPKKINSVTELGALKVSLGDFLVQFPDWRNNETL